MSPRLLLSSAGLALTFAVFAASATKAQAPVRITFNRGSDRTVITDTLRGYNDHKSFVIRVRKGQRLTTQNAGGNYITVDITPPRGSTYDADLAADCHDRHEVDPTAGGDYILRVTECQKADRWRGTFKLRVVVR